MFEPELLRPVCQRCFGHVFTAKYCDKCLDAISKLARKVAIVAGRFDVIAPVTAEDLEGIRAVLADAVEGGKSPLVASVALERGTKVDQVVRLRVLNRDRSLAWTTVIIVRSQ